MILKLQKVNALKVSGIASILYLILSLLVSIPFAIFTNMMGNSEMDRFLGQVLFIFLPLFYTIFGFIVTYVAILIFNFMTQKVGGIEMEFEENSTDSSKN